MEGQIARVNTKNSISLDLLAGVFEADAGYDIEELSSNQLHIIKADNNVTEEILITKKPTYKEGGVFEVQLLSEANDSAYGAGAKLGRMLSGGNLTSHITNALIQIDDALSKISTAMKVEEIDAGKNNPDLDTSTVDYKDFVRLRKKYEKEILQSYAKPKSAQKSSGSQLVYQILGGIFLVIIIAAICKK